MVSRGGQSPLLPKGLMWHAAQYINYGSRQCTCMPQVILFLQWEVCYISDRGRPGGCQGCPAVKEAYPKKHQWGYWRQLCIIGLLVRPFVFIVTRLLMALHFRDPLDLTKYHDMLDWIHLDKKWFFLTQKKERYLLLLEEKNQNAASNTNPT